MRKVAQKESESFNSKRERKMKSRVSLAHKIHGIRPPGLFRVHAEKIQRHLVISQSLTGAPMSRF